MKSKVIKYNPNGFNMLAQQGNVFLYMLSFLNAKEQGKMRRVNKISKHRVDNNPKWGELNQQFMSPQKIMSSNKKPIDLYIEFRNQMHNKRKRPIVSFFTSNFNKSYGEIFFDAIKNKDVEMIRFLCVSIKQDIVNLENLDTPYSFDDLNYIKVKTVAFAIFTMYK